MDIKTQAEIYAENFRLIPETKGWYQQKVDDFTAGYEAALRQFAVSGRSEQFVCLCPRNETDNCDRKEPCKECETCPHFRQTNCH